MYWQVDCRSLAGLCSNGVEISDDFIQMIFIQILYTDEIFIQYQLQLTTIFNNKKKKFLNIFYNIYIELYSPFGSTQKY